VFRDVKNRNRKPGRKRNSLIFIYGLKKNTSYVYEICHTLYTILGLLLTCRSVVQLWLLTGSLCIRVVIAMKLHFSPSGSTHGHGLVVKRYNF